MYQVAERLDPDSYLALARAVYAEMALAGIGCVGEFHYLHHGPGGAGYADPNAMGRALIEAAAQAGLRHHPARHLLPAGGLDPAAGRVPLAARSSGSATAPRRRGRTGCRSLGADSRGMLGPAARVGAAIHSVRAVPPEQMPAVAAWTHASGAPLHVHLSEQVAENDACLAATGARRRRCCTTRASSARAPASSTRRT